MRANVVHVEALLLQTLTSSKPSKFTYKSLNLAGKTRKSIKDQARVLVASPEKWMSLPPTFYAEPIPVVTLNFKGD